ncbi:MAG: hypothetical protein N2746_03420 [Deltaproteobacteria bacterium]|nr:hypothetical protein [Deltaproteobacteria bacterium]
MPKVVFSSILLTFVFINPLFGANIIGFSEEQVKDFFEKNMPGWEFNGKGFKNLEYKNKDYNFKIKIYVDPNVIGAQFIVDNIDVDKVPDGKDKDLNMKKMYHIEDKKLKPILKKLFNSDKIVLTPMESDAYFTKAQETGGQLGEGKNLLPIKVFSVMTLPKEKYRITTKVTVGRTY